MQNTPILYSLQNCPYAMRARIALFKSQQQVLIRAVKLNNKPVEMLATSPKGSVPVLVLEKNIAANKDMILEESLEVMLWALSQNDPDNLLHTDEPIQLPTMVTLISEFERDFIPAFNAYSCAKRYHEDNLGECREACEVHIQNLEARLTEHRYLLSDKESLLDIALVPFIRKFARIERQWYLQSPYPKLRQWLDSYLQSAMFSKVMEKHELWLENRKDIYFGPKNKSNRSTQS
ncbi:glutathione S-transferase [Vibrio lamellibrachiae]|uniref:glutathione S-transferase n=1 Tax=Vibrio lamellibrachiae TaxID=2910253 RepID=UPI003D13F5DF